MGFAILWIMLFHLRVPTDLAVIDFIRSVGYGGVDIFLFLSGFGLYYSLSRKNFNLTKYYKSRFFRIVPEYWVVIGIVFLAQMDFSARAFYLLICKATTLGYWIGYRDESWFISCILFLYAIYPIYFKLFKKYGLKASFHFIGAGFSLMLIYALTCIFFYDSKNYGGFIILTYARIPIFFIGAIFGHWAKDGCNIKLTKRLKVIGLSAAIIASVALVFFQTFLFYALQTCSLAYLPYIIITLFCACFLRYFLTNTKQSIKFSQSLG